MGIVWVNVEISGPMKGMNALIFSAYGLSKLLISPNWGLTFSSTSSMSLMILIKKVEYLVFAKEIRSSTISWWI